MERVIEGPAAEVPMFATVRAAEKGAFASGVMAETMRSGSERLVWLQGAPAGEHMLGPGPETIVQVLPTQARWVVFVWFVWLQT